MEKEVLIDTNIIRRLIEDNATMIRSISTIKNDGFNFMVSDMTLFELVDYIKTKKDYYKFLSILYDNNIAPIFKEKILNFGKQYCEWFKKPIPIIELKKQLLPSFSMSLATVLTDLAKAIMLFLANKLTSDYSSYFYNSILEILNDTTKEHFEQVIAHSYLGKGEPLKKRLPLEYRDLVIRELTYFNLLQKYEEYDSKQFSEEYDKQNKRYEGLSFNDICAEILTENDMRFNLTEIGDNNDAIFMVNFIKDVLYRKRKFQINDIADYINFKYALQFCDFYFTTDDSSLKKYERYFKDDSKIQEYIRRSRGFTLKYKVGI